MNKTADSYNIVAVVGFIITALNVSQMALL